MSLFYFLLLVLGFLLLLSWLLSPMSSRPDMLGRLLWLLVESLERVVTEDSCLLKEAMDSFSSVLGEVMLVLT